MNQVNCFGQMGIFFTTERCHPFKPVNKLYLWLIWEFDGITPFLWFTYIVRWACYRQKSTTSDISVSLTETYVFKAKSSKLNELAGGHGRSIVILLSLLSFTVTLPICPRIGFPGHLAPIVSLYPLILCKSFVFFYISSSLCSGSQVSCQTSPQCVLCT